MHWPGLELDLLPPCSRETLPNSAAHQSDARRDRPWTRLVPRL